MKGEKAESRAGRKTMKKGGGRGGGNQRRMGQNLGALQFYNSTVQSVVRFPNFLDFNDEFCTRPIAIPFLV